MAFASPYNGNVSRKMSKFELVQAIRQNISGEIEAIYFYEGHVYATDDPYAKKVLQSIADEEKVHVGELFELLKYLEPDTAKFFIEGNEEAKKIIENKKQD